LDIAIAGGLAITITTTDVTLANTAGTSSVTNIGSTTAQYAILNVSGAMTAARSLILPSSSRRYVINNSCTGGYVLTVKGAATTGVTMRNGESAQVAWNGSDYVKVSSGTSGTSGVNTAIGVGTLDSVQSAELTTAFGYNALNQIINGARNVAIGTNSLVSTTFCNDNTAIGSDALYSTLDGTSNVGVGSGALYFNSTGSYNTAVGYRSLYNTASATSNNTGFGYAALYLATGANNTAIGSEAGFAVTLGAGNISVGGLTSAGTRAPVFSITTENNRISMGSTSVTNAYVQVAWTVVSDARDKTDFADVPHGLDFVSKLQPTAYRFKENRDATEGHGPVRYGFKAQDVLALEGDAPVIIDADNPDKLYFNDQALLAVLVNAIKELKAEFDAYKAAHA
jgi:hypothetical protein